MFRRCPFRRCGPTLALPHGLQLCLDAVIQRRVSLELDDIYKICALVTAAKDPLDLGSNAEFMGAVFDASNTHNLSSMNPFQGNVIKDAFAKTGADGCGKRTGVLGADNDNETAEADNPIVQSLKHALKEFKDRGTYDARSVNAVVEELNDAETFRDLDVSELTRIIDILSQIHHQDFQLTARLARRAAELTGQMSLHQKTLCFLRLNQMDIPDSLAALVSSIGAQLDSLTERDARNIIFAVQKHRAADLKTIPLVSRACAFLSGTATSPGGMADLKKFDVAFLIVVLEVCAKYEQSKAPHMKLFFDETLRRTAEWEDRHLLLVLQVCNVVPKGFIDAAVFKTIHDRAKEVVATMHPKYVDQTLDAISMLPYPADGFMTAMLDRIVKDSQFSPNFQPSQLCFVLHLVASYPPAKGHKALVTLASQAHARREHLGHDGLIMAVLALTEIQFIGDHFYDICATLLMLRKGFKTTPEFFDFVSLLKPQNVQDERMLTVLAGFVHFLHNTMTPEDLQQLQHSLLALGVDDKRINHKIINRATEIDVDFKKQLQQQQMAAKEHYQRQQEANKRNGGGGGPNRPPEPSLKRPGMMSPEEMAMLGKRKPEPPKLKKKPFSLKRAEWDMS